MIKLAISGRVVEKEKDLVMDVDDFLRLARETGYEGVELRRSQVNPDMEQREHLKEILEELMLKISFLTADPVEKEKDFKIFKKWLLFARELEVNLMRVIAEKVEICQRCADIVREIYPSLCLFAQMHIDSPFETVEGAAEMMQKIRRENFGLSFEPGNFVLSEQDYSYENLVKIKEWLFNVQFQEIKPFDAPERDNVLEFRGKKFQRCLPIDRKSINLDTFFDALRRINYSGWITIIEPVVPFIEPRELAILYRKMFRKYIK